MQSDEGILRSFLEEVPKGWTDLTAGQIVNIKDCYFRIVNVDIKAQEMILKPIPKTDALKEILGVQMKNIEDHKHYCN